MAAKIIRILAIVIISIILLNIILFLVFSIPSVQNYAANVALNKLKPILGTELSIDGIRIKLFNRVQLDGIYVEDQQQDTLLYADKLTARVNIMNLLDNTLSIKGVELENFTAKVNRETPETPFNFQFIIDAFKKDDKPKDTTKTALKVEINDIRLKNGTMRFDILSQPHTPGQFNPDHFFVQNFNLKGSLNSIDMKHLIADVDDLDFDELYAGIRVEDFRGMVRSEDTRLWSDRISLTLNNSDLWVTGAQYDTYSKEFMLTAKSETIDPADAAIFSRRFAHLQKPFSFDVDLEGKLPQVVITRINATYGANTNIAIEGLISDYSKFNDSDLNIDIKDLSVTADDLEALIRIGAPRFVSPRQLRALGNISLRLQAQGKLSNFRYDGFIRTQQGDVTLSGLGIADKGFKNFSFEGPVSTNNVQLANIIGDKAGVDDVSLRTHAKLTRRRGSPLTVVADGNIVSALYKGYRYNNLHFDGRYSGRNIAASINTDTELNKLDLFADITFGKNLAFVVNGTVDRLDLRPFIEAKNWKRPSLTARIDGNLSGSSIDNMVGTLVVDSASLIDSTFIYNPGPIYLQAFADEGTGKKMQIMSSFLEAEITGDYYFTTVANEIMHAVHPHLPSLINQPRRQRAENGKNNFQFNILLKNTEDISYAFSLPFYNIEPATITGNVDMVSSESILLNAYVPRLMFGTNDIRETKIDLQNGQLTGINLNANTYLVQDNGHINARLNTIAASDSINNRLFYDVYNKAAQSNGELLVSMGFLRDMQEQLTSNIRLHPATVMFNGKNIDFNEATIVHRKERIEIDNFGLRENGMLLLGIEGVASKNPNENIRAYFNETELATILAAFNISNFTGSINGDIVVHQALGSPMIETKDFRIENITAHNDTIGTLQIEGNWDKVNSGLDLNAFLIDNGERNFEIKGFVPTGKQSKVPMDVNVLLNDFGMEAIRPFTPNIFSDLSGSINSDINITGNLSEPLIEGWLGIDEGIMKVAYTNVTYYVSDTIQVNRDNIGLSNLVIRDQNNQTANLNVSLTHTNFGRMVYSADIRLNDFMLLNNEARTDLMAYGNLKLSGNINVTGSPTGIYGDAYITSESRSEVMVTLPQTAKADEYSGIIFINTPQPTDSLAFLRKLDENNTNTIDTRIATGIPINMRATVDLNPLLRAGVTINPTTGDALEVNGTGELSLTYNSKSSPSVHIYGDYIIDEGKFHYNLQSLRTIDFDIREGSTVTMVGDPKNTQFNITAFHQVKADLATLSPIFTYELNNTRVPVNALLEVRGNLDQMDLQYDIELPESSGDIQQRVNSLLTTEEAKIRQFAYLVTTGNFFSAEGTPDFNFGPNMVTSFAANTLSRGLDALFASALNDNWAISTNLESMDGSFNNVRMGVDVSTRLLDDRLRISTNLSYGDNTSLAGQQAFMGEFELEYDLKSWLMLRAYNRANERFYRVAPYTQGVGVVVTKEAKTFKDLFKFRWGRRGSNEDEND